MQFAEETRPESIEYKGHDRERERWWKSKKNLFDEIMDVLRRKKTGCSKEANIQKTIAEPIIRWYDMRVTA